jgi:predicted component of type VI protein secretion system
MNMESFTPKNIQEEVMEVVSFENVEQSLANLEDKLSFFGKIPGFEKEVDDLKKSIENLKAKIGEKKN